MELKVWKLESVAFRKFSSDSNKMKVLTKLCILQFNEKLSFYLWENLK